MSRFANFKVEESDMNVAPQYEDKSKFLGVGEHNVKIVEVTEEGPDKRDPTWEVYNITLQGAGDKTTRERLLIPTKSKLYVDEKGTWALQKLLKFLNGLVPGVTKDNLGKVLDGLFSSTKTLQDANMKITIKHTRHHAKYVSKGVYHLVTAKGVAVCGDDKVTPLEFSDREGCEGHAAQNSLSYWGFPTITDWGVPQKNPKLQREKREKAEEVASEPEESIF